MIGELERITNALAHRPYPYLEKRCQEVWHDYNQVLIQEELLWYKKSRAKWLCYGNRNTSYFHGTTTIRRRKNTYDILQNEDGVWISDQQELEELVMGFFKNLFTDDDNVTPFCLTGSFPPLSEDECRTLHLDVTNQEIH